MSEKSWATLLIEEIQALKEAYKNGIMSVRPSFNFIVEIEETFGKNDGEFSVADSLDEAEKKAIKLSQRTNDFVLISQIIKQNSDFYAKPIKLANKQVKTFLKCYEKTLVPVVWRTRGKFVNI